MMDEERKRSGNPNPSPETRFKKGQSGNPGGKSSEQKMAELEAARIASEVSLELVTAVQDAIRAADSEKKVEMIRSDVLRLMKDVQDRAHGTPKQTVEQTVAKVKPKKLADWYGGVDPLKGGDKD